MSEALEIEFKTLLNKEEYERLLCYYNLTNDHFFQQTNVYFDTPDFRLKDQGMGLRIRRFATKAEATLKVPQSVGLLEITDSLTLAEIDQTSQQHRFTPNAKNVLHYLQQLAIPLSDLRQIGELTTKRGERLITEGKLALDQSWYCDQTDFELELEVPSPTFKEHDFQLFLKKLDLPYRKTQNKIARAVTAQQKLDKRMEGL